MYTGVYTALVTPFDENREIDKDCLKKIVQFQLSKGISGLVPVGTTGESPTVSHEENIEVIEIVVKEVDGKIPVIAGTGSNSTDEAIRMTKLAKAIGADASLQVSPYYNKPTQEGLYQHFMAIADAVDLPIMVYNVKGRTGVNIETDTLMRMAKHENIVAVKEASGDLNQMMEVIRRKPADFSVLSGDDNLALPLTLMGGNGVVSVAANIIPQWMEELIQAARRGDLEKAKTIHYELLPLFKSMFLETNPIPVKWAMSEMGLVKDIFRLPLCSPGEETKVKIREALKNQGLL
ncbi:MULTISPECIES: 4-hydroxy-tetrahydrodipicolinate synthase [unclassified Oceanispirochaeta]|uniref:4-hydroxy-tetrahydrodipicolinate synthase n=1 Tax=unclassified Oceanispirochaeta TaxID=2635722 RepID=UPI000E091C19|nr:MULTISPECIES: 4-hydroxy-tetrahydrodipicolinate synthase [unclassified Oceanispirochaeta]MBF9015698.1 4-hydroxy-tetrahydrodipicolinate synthase [Oceanispirochaeta sp. M2]NPD72163.1 4-hydroxy-tetrahydrodipicolinate synthase [Oceanispirochaeta sp. M1]RDG32261.1 4-hydroxy-tetrahydrodipicolinate synthase [Oceanispirochaeta sp. M1]